MSNYNNQDFNANFNQNKKNKKSAKYQKKNNKNKKEKDNETEIDTQPLDPNNKNRIREKDLKNLDDFIQKKKPQKKGRLIIKIKRVFKK